MKIFTDNRPLLIASFFITVSLLWGKLLTKIIPPFPVISDSLKYLEIASSIQNGFYAAIEGIVYPPGYPTFIALVQTLLNSKPITLYLIQFLLLGLTSFMVYQLATKYLKVSPLLSFLAGCTILLWPYFILYSQLIMSEVLFTTFFIASIYTLLEAWHSQKTNYFIFTGIILGITTLIRPVVLLLPFWLLFFLVLFTYLKKSKSLPYLKISYGLIAFFITLTPWSTYLFSTTGSILPVSSHLPYVIDKSYNTLSYETGFQAQEKKPEISDVVLSKVKNFFVFWNPGAGGYQAEAITNKFSTAKYFIIIYKAGFFLLLFLAFRAVYTNRKNPLVLIIACTIFYLWCLHTVLFPYPRYTLPVIPLVIILASLTLDKYAKQFYNK